jgi:hypothetical protein
MIALGNTTRSPTLTAQMADKRQAEALIDLAETTRQRSVNGLSRVVRHACQNGDYRDYGTWGRLTVFRARATTGLGEIDSPALLAKLAV